ncbi:hypothetical protein [Methanococcus voltae]|uniref:Uncharacterized protein n=1 Tax=Methanococcus voltae (strain ATCC BAA-1334 / A3) TaxID=456320 RepID=D7DS70_METV3|nr:hypothetical protein [Methanococcus voltae]MCS3901506.1 hypothetical protein [Methanococcus voltae]
MIKKIYKNGNAFAVTLSKSDVEFILKDLEDREVNVTHEIFDGEKAIVIRKN